MLIVDENKSLVSVIVSFLNAEDFIQEAIDSVFAQTFQDWELLLVDDGSTDSSTEIALRCSRRYPERVTYLEHEGHQNRGLPASRNLGMACARGEYIAILDSDDVWLPHKLDRQLSILRSCSGVGMLSGCTEYWQSWTGRPEHIKQDRLVNAGVQLNTVYEPPNLLRLTLSKAAMPPCPSDLLFRTETLLRLGGFEESFSGMYGMFEDQALLAKVYLNVPVFVAEECWDRYRLHPNSICAVQTRAGREPHLRMFYLRWLERYLTQHGVSDPEIWKLLRRRLWAAEHPLAYRFLSRGLNAHRRFRKTIPA